MDFIVSAKSLTSLEPILEGTSMPFPAGLAAGDALSVRQLLEHVVRLEVRAYRERLAERALLRVLMPEQIARAVQTGKVDSGGLAPLPPPVDTAAAVKVAVQAWEDKLYLIFVDDVEVRSLDDPVAVSPQTRLTFVPLTLLSGQCGA